LGSRFVRSFLWYDWYFSRYNLRKKEFKTGKYLYQVFIEGWGGKEIIWITNFKRSIKSRWFNTWST